MPKALMYDADPDLRSPSSDFRIHSRASGPTKLFMVSCLELPLVDTNVLTQSVSRELVPRQRHAGALMLGISPD